MPRPQFTLRALLVAMLVVAIGCVTLPKPLGAVRRWLWPPESRGMFQMVSPRIEITDEDESLLGVPNID